MKTKILQLFCLLLITSYAYAKDYQIYSIVQNIPMGEENEIIKKNFYINIGANQGVHSKTILNVYRSLSRIDPYETKKRFNYKVKIGELKVLHSEDNISIASLLKVADSDKENELMFEISNFMIGDRVRVKIK